MSFLGYLSDGQDVFQFCSEHCNHRHFQGSFCVCTQPMGVKSLIGQAHTQNGPCISIPNVFKTGHTCICFLYIVSTNTNHLQTLPSNLYFTLSHCATLYIPKHITSPVSFVANIHQQELHTLNPVAMNYCVKLAQPPLPTYVAFSLH